MNHTFEELKGLTFRGIWKYVRSQPVSFWFVCAYLFFEYVRPQSMYPTMDVIPWGRTIIFLALVSLAFEGRFPKLNTSGSRTLVLFSLVVVLSCFFAFRPDIAFEELEGYLSWVVIFFIITTSVTTQERFFIFTLLFLLASFKMSQFGARSWASIGFGFRDWGVSGAPGWFANSGELGIQMAIFLPMAVAFIWGLRDHWPKWGRLKLGLLLLFPLTAIMTIIATSSRGAIVGLAALLLWWLAFVSRRPKTFLAAAVVVAGAYVLIPEEQMARFEAAGDDRTSTERTNRWEDGIAMMNDHPILGVGYNNWTPYYRTHFPQRESHGLSHNIFVEAGSELGYTGLLAFLLMIVATFRMNARTRRLMRAPPGQDRFLYLMAFGLDGALVGYLSTGFFITVMYYPYFWINLALTVALHQAARNRVSVMRRVDQELPVLAPGYPGATEVMGPVVGVRRVGLPGGAPFPLHHRR